MNLAVERSIRHVLRSISKHSYLTDPNHCDLSIDFSSLLTKD
jgi:hypothetical protein